jgi:hypothetical protein
MQTCAYSHPIFPASERSVRSPVIRWPIPSIRPSFLISKCTSSPRVCTFISNHRFARVQAIKPRDAALLGNACNGGLTAADGDGNFCIRPSFASQRFNTVFEFFRHFNAECSVATCERQGQPHPRRDTEPTIGKRFDTAKPRSVATARPDSPRSSRLTIASRPRAVSLESLWLIIARSPDRSSTPTGTSSKTRPESLHHVSNRRLPRQSEPLSALSVTRSPPQRNLCRRQRRVRRRQGRRPEGVGRLLRRCEPALQRPLPDAQALHGEHSVGVVSEHRRTRVQRLAL